MFQRYVHPGEDSTLVVTNLVQKYFGTYYFQYDTTKVRFIAFKEVGNVDLKPYSHIFILRNPSTEDLSYLRGNIPEPVERSILDAEKVFDEANIRLYKIDRNKDNGAFSIADSTQNE